MSDLAGYCDAEYGFPGGELIYLIRGNEVHVGDTITAPPFPQFADGMKQAVSQVWVGPAGAANCTDMMTSPTSQSCASSITQFYPEYGDTEPVSAYGGIGNDSCVAEFDGYVYWNIYSIDQTNHPVAVNSIDLTAVGYSGASGGGSTGGTSTGGTTGTGVLGDNFTLVSDSTNMFTHYVIPTVVAIVVAVYAWRMIARKSARIMNKA